MSDMQRENHGSENKFLDELIDAARADAPAPARADAAQRRLMDRLAGEHKPLTRTVDWREKLTKLLFGSRVRAVGLSLSLATAILIVIAIPALLSISGNNAAQAASMSTPGELLIQGAGGELVGVCPLRHTDVVADVSGFVSRVTVKQTFYNSSPDKIEAVYVFPLPENAAVDRMELLIGDKRIVGSIKPRPEARQIYEQAKQQGHVAGLLDQERPNIFTQSVANIEPGVAIQVEISYVQTLKYEEGGFEFNFPMVVAPRYIPGAAAQGPQAAGTAQVPDAASITPPMAPSAPPAGRDGNDISLTVNLDAGLDIQNIQSKQHDVAIDRPSHTQAVIKLKNQREIPNRDFILRCETATDRIGDAMLVHSDAHGTFFTFLFEPPKWTQPSQIVPKEMIFVIDKSGSMRGWKIEKAKAAMKACLQGLTPEDTFNLLSFSGGLGKLFESPQPASPDNIQKGLTYLDNTQSGGGTEMMPAIMAALEKPVVEMGNGFLQQLGDSNYSRPLHGVFRKSRPQDAAVRNADNSDFDGPFIVSTQGAIWFPLYDPNGLLAPTKDGEEIVVQLSLDASAGPDRTRLRIDAVQAERLRIVGFMTDGEVGNDFGILDAVRKNAGTTRVFSFGVGDSINRFLLQGMADLGRGAVEFVDSSADPAEAAKKFFVRVNAPLLTDIGIDWGGLPVEETYPNPLPDLFSAQPVMIHGRMKTPLEGAPAIPANANITLRGRTAAGLYERKIPFNPNAAAPQNAALSSLWARAKIENLMRSDMRALQQNNFPEEIKNQIIQLGVEFGLMTQFTSFVAVEADRVTKPAVTKKVDIAVEKPAGEFDEAANAGFKSPLMSDDAPATHSNDFIVPDPQATPAEKPGLFKRLFGLKPAGQMDAASNVLSGNKSARRGEDMARGDSINRAHSSYGNTSPSSPENPLKEERTLTERAFDPSREKKVAGVQSDLWSLTIGVKSYYVDNNSAPMPNAQSQSQSLAEGMAGVEGNGRLGGKAVNDTVGPSRQQVAPGTPAPNSYFNRFAVTDGPAAAPAVTPPTPVNPLVEQSKTDAWKQNQNAPARAPAASDGQSAPTDKSSLLPDADHDPGFPNKSNSGIIRTDAEDESRTKDAGKNNNAGQASPPAATYDPSNGTTTNGDVWRAKSTFATGGVVDSVGDSRAQTANTEPSAAIQLTNEASPELAGQLSSLLRQTTQTADLSRAATANIDPALHRLDLSDTQRSTTPPALEPAMRKLAFPLPQLLSINDATTGGLRNVDCLFMKNSERRLVLVRDFRIFVVLALSGDTAPVKAYLQSLTNRGVAITVKDATHWIVELDNVERCSALAAMPAVTAIDAISEPATANWKSSGANPAVGKPLIDLFYDPTNGTTARGEAFRTPL